MAETVINTIDIKDATSGSFARIAPDHGWNLVELSLSTSDGPVAVIDSPPSLDALADKPSRYGIPLLFPFPNRIREGKFEWNGTSYSLPVSDAFGNAIHGFCLRQPWTVTEISPAAITGSFRMSEVYRDFRSLWPADFQIDVTYRIVSNGLRADVAIHNPDDRPLPWGFGTHAYFRLPLGSQGHPSRCTVEVAADSYWELDKALPTGRILPVDESRDLRDGADFDTLQLDDVLTGLPPGLPHCETIITDEVAGRQLRQLASPEFRHVVVFTPPERPVICLEPYTCVTDAVNLEGQGIDTGWKVLGPGESTHLWWEFRLEPVIA